MSQSCHFCCELLSIVLGTTSQETLDKVCYRGYFSDLDRWIGVYLEAAGGEGDPKVFPLFRLARGNRKVLSDGRLVANDMRRCSSGG